MPRPFQLTIDDDLEIRQRQPGDAEELFALLDANRAYLMEWLGWLNGCTSVADVRASIETTLHGAEAGVCLEVVIVERGKIVGVTGFHTIRPGNRIGQIGYWVGAEHQGRGLVTRALRGLIRHGFQVLELNRITIAAAAGNHRSRAIAERLGFQFEGIAREAEWLYTRFVDHAVYSLLRSDPGQETRPGPHPAISLS